MEVAMAVVLLHVRVICSNNQTTSKNFWGGRSRLFFFIGITERFNSSKATIKKFVTISKSIEKLTFLMNVTILVKIV